MQVERDGVNKNETLRTRAVICTDLETLVTGKEGKAHGKISQAVTKEDP